MRYMHFWTTLLTGTTIVTALAGQARAQTTSTRTGDHIDPSPGLTSEFDPESGMTFNVFTDGEAIVVRGQAGSVWLEKRNRRDGATSFTVADASDLVTVQIDQHAIVASRQGAEARVAIDDPDRSTAMRTMQSLLEDSPAVAAIDRLVARLAVRPARVSLVESLRQVHLWTRRLRGRPAPAHTLVAGLSVPGSGPVRTAAGGMSCWMMYEREIWEAYSEFAGCYRNSFYFFDGEMVRDSCGFLYYMRAESAWFELLSCIAFPW